MKHSVLTRILVILSMTAGIVGAETDATEFRVESLSFEEGVSHNLVYSIVQDKYGFMWFGTMYGLIRYDGEEYVKYKHNPDDTSSISNDDIVCILETKEGDLWLGTYSGGLNRYIRTDNSFKRFGRDYFKLGDKWDGTIWEMAEDDNGNLWIATRGAGAIRYNYREDNFEAYDFTGSGKNGHRSNSVLGLSYDKNSESVWIVSGSGLLNKYESNKDKFVSFDPFENSTEPGFDYLTKVISFTDTSLILGSNKGPVLFNLNTEEFTKLSFINDSLMSRSSVQTLLLDNKNRLWTGTNTGLFVTDLGTRITTRLTDNEQKYIRNAITVCEDKTGIIWAGSYLQGIYKIYSGKSLFKTVLTDNPVFALGRYNEMIVAAGRVGLTHYDLNSGEFVSKNKFPRSIADKGITSIAEDSLGNYWFGTPKGLYAFFPVENKLIRYIHKQDKSYTLTNNFINCIAAGSDNRVWIGTGNGLNEYSPARKKFRRVTPLNSSMKGINVISVYEDLAGDVWFGTFLGLNRYIPESDTVIVYKQDPYNPESLSNNYVYDILEDASGKLWLATAGGLNLFDIDSETFTCFDQNDGLASPVLFGLQEDSTGHIWISSNRGLSRFDPSTKKIVNYDTRDGLQSNMFNGSSVKLSDNRIVFGGINGFDIINPEAAYSDTNESGIVFTSIKIFDNDLTDKNDINSLSKIELTYDQNFIQFRFAATDYRNPQKNQYRYRLKGVDDNWRSNGFSNVADYTNLLPGEYKFEVQTAGSNGAWGRKLKSIDLVIIPPFWETTWFSILVLLLSLAAVYILYRRKVYREIEKRVELEKIKVAENEKVRRKAADDFHDELGHHITKISLYSEILKRQSDQMSEGVIEYLNKISELTKNLSTGVRDFIWTLDPEKDSLYEVAVRLKDFGDDLFDKTGIAFTVDGISEDFQKIKLSVDWRRHLTLMFKEAMNNALKYAGCSSVTLSFNLINRQLNLILRDNGKGIASNKNRSGRGLKSLNERALSLNSKLEVKSIETSGTEIRFEGELA